MFLLNFNFWGRRKIFIYMVYGIIALAVIINFIPIKVAIDEKEIRKTKANEFPILCEYTQSTGPNWVLEKDFSDKQTKKEYIDITGNVPGNKFKAGVLVGNNKYILYGHFTETKIFHGEVYRVFYATSWDISYPISRFSIREYFSPKKFLTLYDLIS